MEPREAPKPGGRPARRRGFRAIDLAIINKPRILAAYVGLEREAEAEGIADRVRTIARLISEHAVSINMSLTSLLRFLADGYWLNVYESSALEAKKKGSSFRETLRERLNRFYGPRRQLDRALGLGLRCHYAAANFGGAGPTRYGDCCVILNKDRWQTTLVTYPGDSILSSFGKDGTLSRPESDLRDALALGDDVGPQAVLHNREFATQRVAGVAVGDIRAILESPTEMIECYLDGPVEAESIERVIMPRGVLSVLWQLALESKSMARPWPEKYDLVDPFLLVKEELDRRRIPLVGGEP